MKPVRLGGIKLAAWDETEPRKSVVELGPVRLGAAFAVIAAFEGEGGAGAVLAAARAVKTAGADAFRWTGPEGTDLSCVREVAAAAGLPVVVEVTDTKDVAPAAAVADGLMVGAANMQNFSLLKELGRSSTKPVLLVRGWHATLKEWLNCAEYILFEGNPRVILCDAGIRGFESDARPIMDLSAVPAVKAVSHLPVLVDLGRAGHPGEIEKLGLAAVAAGADGLVVDVALGEGAAAAPAASGALSLEAFARLAPKLAAMSRLTEGLRIDHD